MTYYKIALHVTYYAVIILAYLVLVTLVGYVRAYVSDKMGDSTAREQGMMTLNPLMHIDLIGLALLLLYNFGWGRQVMLNPNRIFPPYRWLKVLIAAFSSTFVYILLAAGGNVLLHTMADHAMVASQGIVLSQYSTVGVLRLFLGVCLFLSSIEFVINITSIVLFYLAEWYEDLVPYIPWLVFFIPFGIFMVFGNQICSCMWHLVLMVVTLCTHIFTFS